MVMQVFHASPKLAAVGSVDEAVVIGAALALSSSAFVLQLMSERGELATKFGSATLGILLLQVSKAAYVHPASVLHVHIIKAALQLLLVYGYMQEAGMVHRHSSRSKKWCHSGM